jgi:hypothetical protein
VGKEAHSFYPQSRIEKPMNEDDEIEKVEQEVCDAFMKLLEFVRANNGIAVFRLDCKDGKVSLQIFTTEEDYKAWLFTGKPLTDGDSFVFE